MGEQSGSRIGGDDYQHLFSWYLLLQLLRSDGEFEHAYIEHPRAGAADDVTLHPRAEYPAAAAKYYQIKWHVSAADHYDFDSLTTVKKKGASSLIQKLYQSWKTLKAGGPVEIWLVSNWPAARGFGKFIHDDYAFNALFHSCSDRSKAGQGRKLWQHHTGTTDLEIGEFCRDLRMLLGFVGTRMLEEMVDERMSNNGLKSGDGPRSVVLAAIRKIIKAGGAKKKITRESMIELITENGLWAEAKDNPKVRLEIHGWIKRAFDEPPTIELDWTDHFDRDTRQIPDDSSWRGDLLPQLAEAQDVFRRSADTHYIDFRGKLPLTTVLAVGATFPEVAGFAFRAEQPTDSEINLWRSDTPPTRSTFARSLYPENRPGGDILVFLSISGNGKADAERFFGENSDRLAALVYAEPAAGTGSSSIKSAGDAVALANDAKALIKEHRSIYRASTVHLILYAPATFCLFLGQKLNAMGRIVTYERTSDGGYRESVSISTG